MCVSVCMYEVDRVIFGGWQAVFVSRHATFSWVAMLHLSVSLRSMLVVRMYVASTLVVIMGM